MSTQKPRRRGRTGDPSHAPGKKHRAPVPTVHGVKHSDQRIAKGRLSAQLRRSGPKG